MGPSFRAFSEELMLIKQAQKEPKPAKNLKKVFKGMLLAGAGAGAGGATFAVMRPLLKKIVPKMLPKHQKAIGATAGILGSIGTMAALVGSSQAFKEADE